VTRHGGGAGGKGGRGANEQEVEREEGVNCG